MLLVKENALNVLRWANGSQWKPITKIMYIEHCVPALITLDI